jgi:hypothetical protein
MANGAGQHAFLAQLEGGNTAAYLLDADGTLSLILKSGTTTNLGTITDVGGGNWFGVGLNTQGQMLLPVRIDRGANTLVLLTPSAP